MSLAETSSVSEPAAQPTLARKSYAGAVWALVGYGFSQALRLASTLLLTHLLAPEYFGLMALVNVFMIGLAMFSDIGIGPHIIQSARGDDRTFLDTAFTVQAIRGGILWLACILGAWPFARFYDEHALLTLLPVVGLSAAIAGFNSTNIFTAYRRMELGRLTILDLGCQTGAAIFTVVFAYIAPSVWVLVASALVSAVLRVLGSHFYLHGGVNRFKWDPECAKDLAGFGRWIFLSTLLSFATSSAGSLVLGKFVSMQQLGIFSLMVTMAKVGEQAYEQISGKVLLPLYVKIRDLPIEQIRARLLKVRLACVSAFVPPLLILAIFGQQIIDLFFDPRYHDGSWIFQLFCVCAIPMIVAGTSQYYLAQGNSRLMMFMSAGRLFFYVSAIFVGYYINGSTGIIWGMGLHVFLNYALELAVQRRYGVFTPSFDLVVLALCGVALWVGLKFTHDLHFTRVHLPSFR